VVPFIATLAMFTMARGLALWLSDKTPVSLFSLDGVRWFGNGEVIGIPRNRVLVSVYIVSGLLAGVAAIVTSGRLNAGSPTFGQLAELDAIAAVVIGGSALQGGRATIVGTFLGVITFALIFNLLTLMDLAVEIQQITKGLIILAAVLVQRRER
jgi:ribose transport system permease protein